MTDPITQQALKKNEDLLENQFWERGSKFSRQNLYPRGLQA